MSTSYKHVSCPCGGTWYDSQHNPHGTVGFIKQRNMAGVMVACTKCGRVGQRARSKIEALDLWMAHSLKYGPLEDDKQ